MTIESITLQVGEDLAQAYRAASIADRSKFQLLLDLWLREMFTRTTPLAFIMDELSDKAQTRGLTAEKLETMLHDR